MQLKKIYLNKVLPAMKARFGYKNALAVPKITKVTINVGTGKYRQDQRALDEIKNVLIVIAGQRPVATLAKKAISTFKIREGMEVGMKATLRGDKMYSFIERLVYLALPRTRDFRGINQNSIDQRGNLSIGIREHIVFPEISQENIHHIFSFEVVITTTAKSKEEGLELFKLLGFPMERKK